MRKIITSLKLLFIVFILHNNRVLFGAQINEPYTSNTKKSSSSHAKLDQNTENQIRGILKKYEITNHENITIRKLPSRHATGAGVDILNRLWVDFAEFNSLSPEEKEFVILHEAGHLTKNHARQVLKSYLLKYSHNGDFLAHSTTKIMASLSHYSQHCIPLYLP